MHEAAAPVTLPVSTVASKQLPVVTVVRMHNVPGGINVHGLMNCLLKHFQFGSIVMSENGTRIDPDPGDVLHASVDARHSDVPTFTKCIQLDLLVSLLTCLHRPPCSRTTCLLDIAWPGNLAGQGAVPFAEVQIPAWALTGSHLPFFFLHCDIHVS